MQSTDELKWRPRIVWLVVASHVLAFFAFSAVYWFDSISYINVSYFLQRGNLFDGYYQQSPARYMYQHIGLGIPELWALCILIFHKYAWFFYAFFQRGVAVASLLYFLTSFRNRLSGKWRFIASGVICFSPFYQSMHNSVMTESLAGSVILFFSGLTIRLYDSEKVHKKLFYFILFLCFLAPNIRSELVFAVPLLLGIHLFRKSAVSYLGILCVGLGFIFMPTMKYLKFGEFLLPNSDFVNPMHASQTLQDPTSETRDYLSKVDFPTGFKPGFETLRKMDYRDLCITWIFYLKNKGMNDRQLRDFFNDITLHLRADPNMFFLTKFSAALPSLGIIRWSPSKDTSHIYGDATPPMIRDHYKGHLAWLSWQWSDYQTTFESFAGRFRNEQPRPYELAAIDQIEQTIGPYVHNSNFLRRLYFVQQLVPTDIFAALAILLGFISIFNLNLRPLGVLLLPILAKFCVLVNIGCGDIRYSYEFLPIAEFMSVLLLWHLSIKVKVLKETLSKHLSD